MVVTRINQHSILETGELVANLGCHAFVATKASTPSNCPNFAPYKLRADEIATMFDKLLEIRDRYGITVDTLEPHPACAFHSRESREVFGRRNCTAGKTNCTVGFDGSVRPCSHVSDSYGNISDGLQVAWDGMGVWRDGTLIPDNCKQVCGEYPRKCGGGCRAEAKSINGSLGSPDPMCLGGRPKYQRSLPSVDHLPTHSRVTLARGVRFRPEAFGYIAYRSAAKWLAIDKKLYDLLMSTISGGCIDADTVRREYSVSLDDALSTITRLTDKKITKVVN